MQGSRLSYLSFALVVLVPVSARADPPPEHEASPAWRYAHGSLSFGGGGGFVLNAASNTTSTGISAQGLLRWVTPPGFVLSGVVEFGGAMTWGQVAGMHITSGTANAGVGVGAGWAFALSDDVVFTPQILAQAGGAYGDFGPFGGTTWGFGYALRGELPIEVFVGRHAAIEPLLFAVGGRYLPAQSLPPSESIAVGAGMRIMFVM